MKNPAPTALKLAALLALAPLALAQSAGPGAFHSLHAPTTGTVSVTTRGGKSVLTLHNLKTEPGPDVEVWLYRNAAPKKGTSDAVIARGEYVRVGMLKRFEGTFDFPLPANVKASDFASVVLWCDLVDTAFAAAPLRR